jgi:hypothetical protein
VVGCSGAIWLDADGDGRKSSPHEYAQRLLATSKGELVSLLDGLRGFDEAVAAQAAHLFQAAGGSLSEPTTRAALENAAPETQQGFRSYLQAWRETAAARTK